MIPTWQEQAKKDPDWDSGMITNQMIQEKMQEEIDALRSKVDKMRDNIVSLSDDLFAERRECLKLEKELALQRLSDIGQAIESFDRTASHMADEYVSYPDEQEPVAWMHTNSKQLFASTKPSQRDLHLFTPLYTKESE